jgi:hypothetical protein
VQRERREVRKIAGRGGVWVVDVVQTTQCVNAPEVAAAVFPV